MLFDYNQGLVCPMMGMFSDSDFPYVPPTQGTVDTIVIQGSSTSSSNRTVGGEATDSLS